MQDDLNRLTEELPYGWSFTAHRKSPKSPRLYGAFSKHQELETRPSYDVDEVIDEARKLQAERGEGKQLALFS